MLTRISDEEIKDIIAPYRGKLTDEDKKKPLFTLEKDVAKAQLEADQKVMDELQGWYDRLLEDYKWLKKERTGVYQRCHTDLSLI